MLYYDLFVELIVVTFMCVTMFVMFLICISLE